MSWLGLDIGGANLKAADGCGFAAIRPFEVWKAPGRLAEEIGALVAGAPKCDTLAVTMTAELADCYSTKTAGVNAILEAVETVAGQRRVAVYLTDGRFIESAAARELPLLAAASNWHALSAFANRFVPSWPAMLLDVGSTTADVIPLLKSGPAATGRIDTDRLLSGELLYSGVGRTPICAVVRTLPFAGRECPVAAEFFATTSDAYLLLEQVEENETNLQTADGRAFTREAAHARMARMFCGDAEAVSLADAQLAARAVRDAQLRQLEAAVRKAAGGLKETPKTFIISGQGEFLLRMLVERLPWPMQVVSLSKKLGVDVSRCAPAHALAVLARQQGGCAV
jgi:probable H4MPT-linked C1 transfer pathway protein